MARLTTFSRLLITLAIVAGVFFGVRHFFPDIIGGSSEAGTSEPTEQPTNADGDQSDNAGTSSTWGKPGGTFTPQPFTYSAPAPVNGNAFLAEEVFFNIIDNAINYNRENGSVAVAVSETERQIAVEIRDTGIGIPAGSLERIFERFYRVDKGRSRNTGGTGLGLAIVKHSAQLLGWELSVDSSDSGTSFTVIIPKPA